MADESKYIGSASNDASGGSQAWSNPTNAVGSNNTTYASGKVANGSDIGAYLNAQIVKGGSRTGDIKDVSPESKATKTYGGASDLWGVSLSDSDVNASNFGVSFQGVDELTTNYLVGTSFGFGIPEGATVNGIKIDVVCEKYYHALTGTAIRVYSALMTVYYTESTGGSGKAMRTFARII